MKTHALAIALAVTIGWTVPAAAKAQPIGSYTKPRHMTRATVPRPYRPFVRAGVGRSASKLESADTIL